MKDKQVVSLVSSSISMSTAGTVYMFSLYGPMLSSKFQFNQTQTTQLATMANAGLFLSGPFWGYLIDHFKGVQYSFHWVGGILCFVGYALVSAVYSRLLDVVHYMVLGLYFLLIGIGRFLFQF